MIFGRCRLTFVISNGGAKITISHNKKGGQIFLAAFWGEGEGVVSLLCPGTGHLD